jgi:hypothetical protein
MIAGQSSQGRRQVLVYKLNGGQPMTGELTELRKTGVRVALSHALNSGEVVRLILPPCASRPSSTGRTIIGHVVTSGTAPAGHLVGIDFGWETGVGGGGRSTAPRARKPWWRRFLSRGTPEPPSSHSPRTTRGRSPSS